MLTSTRNEAVRPIRVGTPAKRVRRRTCIYFSQRNMQDYTPNKLHALYITSEKNHWKDIAWLSAR
jgi:hypothetical protein